VFQVLDLAPRAIVRVARRAAPEPERLRSTAPRPRAFAKRAPAVDTYLDENPTTPLGKPQRPPQG
jgi:hypothetical protein